MMTRSELMRHVQESCRESEEQLAALADNLAGGMVYQIDSGPDGTQRRLTYVSRGVETLHELTREDVGDNPLFIYQSIRPDYRQMVVDREEEAIRLMKRFYLEAPVILPSGRQAWRSFSAAPRRLSSGHVVWDAIELDVTDRRKAQDEQASLEAQLAHSRKMESIGQLAGGIAHDFNNMLAVILGHAEMALGRLALERVDPESPVCRDLASIRTAAERSADLTRQLLAFARKQAVVPKVLDLNEAVSGTISTLGRLIGDAIELRWVPGIRVGNVLMDPGQVAQILVNLCVNSRDAMNGCGRILIETSAVEFSPEYCRLSPGYMPGRFLMISVSDTGCGIDGETMERMFEPFFTTKKVGKGTGLGLSTVHGIVRQSGGFIAVSSEPGCGATFRVYLPRCESPADELGFGISLGTGTANGQRILLVEDEPLIRDLARMMLESLGYDVSVAENPIEALKIVEEARGRFDLMLSDIVMPEMNGLELALNVRRINPDVRMLFMSGYTSDHVQIQEILNADAAFLPKPFSLEDLRLTIQRVLSS
ncbi:MAG TPA: response regulator [Myxococcota bacterium]|nr:response regulator [Myxococcota bacterium]